MIKFLFSFLTCLCFASSIVSMEKKYLELTDIDAEAKIDKSVEFNDLDPEIKLLILSFIPEGKPEDAIRFLRQHLGLVNRELHNLTQSDQLTPSVINLVKQYTIDLPDKAEEFVRKIIAVRDREILSLPIITIFFDTLKSHHGSDNLLEWAFSMCWSNDEIKSIFEAGVKTKDLERVLLEVCKEGSLIYFKYFKCMNPRVYKINGSQCEAVELVDMLIKHGANTDTLASYGTTPLMNMVQNRHLNKKANSCILKLLLDDNNVDVNAQRPDGSTALLLACSEVSRWYRKTEYRDSESVGEESLKSRRARKHAPLLEEIIEELIKRGADPLIANNAGQTARSIVSYGNRTHFLVSQHYGSGLGAVREFLQNLQNDTPGLILTTGLTGAAIIVIVAIR